MCRYTRPVTGTLYVVATPIGNLEDISERAARVLREADVIAAEHPPTARKLLTRLGVTQRPISYNDRARARATPMLLAALADGQSVALMSDAGTPAISDPGQELVRAARGAGARVVPVPGPSAVATLLSVAGVWGTAFRSVGFLPRKAGERAVAIRRIAELGEPTVVFEAPHRLRATLTAIAEQSPGATLVVGRELTKLHEELWTGTPTEALTHFASPRGEFVLLVVPEAPKAEAWPDETVVTALRAARAAGETPRDAVAGVVAASGRGRREVYALWASLEGDGQ